MSEVMFRPQIITDHLPIAQSDTSRPLRIYAGFFIAEHGLDVGMLIDFEPIHVVNLRAAVVGESVESVPDFNALALARLPAAQGAFAAMARQQPTLRPYVWLPRARALEVRTTIPVAGPATAGPDNLAHLVTCAIVLVSSGWPSWRTALAGKDPGLAELARQLRHVDMREEA